MEANGPPAGSRASCFPLRKILTAVLVVAAIFVIGWLVGENKISVAIHMKKSGSNKPGAVELWTQPMEFLYLDGTRILNYKAQLEGGTIGPVRTLTKEAESAKVEASAGGVGLGGSVQHEDEIESTLTPVATSEIWSVLKDLRRDTIPGASVHTVNLEKLPKKGKVKEGWLVRFSTRELVSPAYIRPYLVVRQAATLKSLFPAEVGNEAARLRAREQRRRAKAFAEQIGPDPRFTFAVTSPNPESGSGSKVKVLMPMQYADLTTERSMFEKERGGHAGGHLEVIGKVIRVFRGPEGGTSAHVPVYTDLATRETWQGPLEQASNYLVDRVGHRCVAMSGVKSNEPRELRGRRCLLARLDRETALRAPGMVVLPLVIFK